MIITVGRVPGQVLLSAVRCLILNVFDVEPDNMFRYRLWPFPQMRGFGKKVR